MTGLGHPRCAVRDGNLDLPFYDVHNRLDWVDLLRCGGCTSDEHEPHEHIKRHNPCRGHEHHDDHQHVHDHDHDHEHEHERDHEKGCCADRCCDHDHAHAPGTGQSGCCGHDLVGRHAAVTEEDEPWTIAPPSPLATGTSGTPTRRTPAGAAGHDHMAGGMDLERRAARRPA